MMSVTGVILTYERQVVAWAIGRVEVPDATARRSLDALLAGLAQQEPAFAPISVTVSADPAVPVQLSAGRGGVRYLDPYTAAVLGAGPERLERFFGTVEGWHRWFNASGEQRAAWRRVTSVSNLAFLALILTGAFLWLPRAYSWATIKTRVLFNPKAHGARARDYNWHHVFGIWTALPLVVIVASAVVFAYPWANDLVYRSFGEEPPRRGEGGPPGARAAAPTPASASFGGPMPLETLLGHAAERLDDWQAITIALPRAGDASVRVTIDQGNGGQPQRRHALTLDAASGGEVAFEPFASQSPGRRARTWLRFLHTGEALGAAGQTLAGIVSLTTCLMVWTGLALAYRRLVAPLFKRAAAGVANSP
jgi:uncharacterized iron-regulated membrane protein